MRTNPTLLLAALLCAAASLLQAAPLGTAFTYQGRLDDSGAPANGIYDLRFTIYDSVGGSGVVGGPITNSAVAVSNGLFTVSLDFGAVFDGNARWLEIGARASGGGSFTLMSPRQPLMPTPYSLYAANAGAGGGGIGGSGTAGYVPRFSDSTAVTDSAIIESFGRIGIGTTTPASPLHVKGGSGIRVEGTGVNGSGGQVVFGTSQGSTYVSEGQDDELYLVAPDGIGLGPGNVGIHVASLTDATHALTVAASPGQTNVLRLMGPAGSYQHAARMSFGDGDYAFLQEDTDDHLLMKARQGIQLTTHGTVAVPAVDVVQAVGSGTASPAMHLENTSTGQGIALFSVSHGTDANAVFTQQGSGSIIRGFVSGSLKFEVHNNGQVACQSVQILGGADMAEPFQLSVSDAPAGSVLIIDEERPGNLKLSDGPYDRRVAGVVSGANGVQPGLTLSHEKLGHGDRNVALSGRVYVRADTSNGVIQPGDMLTTSTIAGRAMKVTDHARAQGAILGKAMSRLADPEGMVLVLVTLQ